MASLHDLRRRLSPSHRNEFGSLGDPSFPVVRSLMALVATLLIAVAAVAASTTLGGGPDVGDPFTMIAALG